MKLNIQIFKRKQREEAYKGKCLNGCKPEGTARKAVYISREKYKAVRRIASIAGENGMTIPESLHRKKSHDVVGQIAVSLW